MRLLQSVDLQGMGLRAVVKKESAGLTDSLLRDRFDMKIVTSRDVLLLFLLVVGVIVIITIKLWPSHDYHSRGCEDNNAKQFKDRRCPL